MALLDENLEKKEKTDESAESCVLKEIDKRDEKAKAQLEYQGKSAEFDAKIEELAQTAADFYKKYGEEDWRTELLVGFLDMAVQLRSIIKSGPAFRGATEIIHTAIDVLNQALGMSVGAMMEIVSPTQSSLKMWWTRQKAMRNMRKQTTQMVQQMKWCLEMSSRSVATDKACAGDFDKSMARGGLEMVKEIVRTRKESVSSSTGEGD